MTHVLASFAFILIVLQCAAVILDDNWTVGSPLLPNKAGKMAMAYWNSSIFLLGRGNVIPKQIIEYDIANNEFIDHGVGHFTQDIYGFGQFYHQQHNLLYLIAANGQDLFRINLSTITKETYSKWNAATIPHNVGYNAYGCLASNDEYLFIIGGHDGNILRDVQILSLSTLQWLSNASSLNYARRSAACAIHETSGFLYTLGGYQLEKGRFIEKLNTTNIVDNQWQIGSSTLLYPADGPRIVLYDQDYILVIGGWRAFSPHTANEYIQIIDTTTDSVSVSSSPFNYPVAAPDVIMIHHKIYKFGGVDDTVNRINKWEWMETPTNPPTSNPTKQPTTTPTNPPTSESQNPTKPPTSHPTTGPTLNPTTDPTTGPTLYPTTDPTTNPSDAPSSPPTNNPSRSPSKATNAPSAVPTLTPTTYPTPPNAVITYYGVSIEIESCDDQDSNTECTLDDDDKNNMLQTIQTVDSIVVIVTVDIVDDELVLCISITTDRTNVLRAAVIRSHVWKHVRDNDDGVFGAVEVDEADSECNAMDKDNEDSMRIQWEYLAIGVGSIVICICGLCVGYAFCQRRKTQKELTKVVSVDPSSAQEQGAGEGAGDDTEASTVDTGKKTQVNVVPQMGVSVQGVMVIPMQMNAPFVPVPMPVTGYVSGQNADHQYEGDDSSDDEDDKMYDNDNNDTTPGLGATVTSTGQGPREDMNDNLLTNTQQVMGGKGVFETMDNVEPVLSTPENE
eukprot:931093_1